MQVTFGKHHSKSMELLVLKEAAYIDWLLKEHATGKLRDLQVYGRSLIEHFDKKQILTKCFVKSCSAHATCFSVYRDNLAPIWWCDECDPYQLGALAGRLQILRTYHDALRHAQTYCTTVADLKTLITSLARAKGLPQRVGEPQASKFSHNRSRHLSP